MRRLLSGLGALALLGIVGVTSIAAVANLPKAPAQPSLVAQLWGAPDPQIVNRIVTGLAGPPAGLVEIPVLEFEDVSDDVPDYFDRLHTFSYLGNDDPAGYIGALPEVGNGALDFADLVVHVRGPLLCIPRAAVVIETDDAVQIGIYYGRPDAPAGTTAPENATACPLNESVTGSVLIPLQLSAPLGDRVVQTVSGDAIREVKVPQG